MKSSIEVIFRCMLLNIEQGKYFTQKLNSMQKYDKKIRSNKSM